MITIQKDIATLAVEKYEAANGEIEPYRFGTKSTISRFADIKRALSFAATGVEVDEARLTDEELDFLLQASREVGDRSMVITINAMRALRDKPEFSKIGNIRGLASGMVRWLSSIAIDGWIYERSEAGFMLPWVIRSIDYVPSTKLSDAHVIMKLMANGVKDSSKTLIFDKDDIVKKTMPELLASIGFCVETADVKAEYMQHVERFHRFNPMHGTQFLCKKSITGEPFKAINDEGVVNRKFRTEVSNHDWEQFLSEGKENLFTEVPFHCFISMFNLSSHAHEWVHVSNMEIYEYDRTLGEKLILPDHHRDLVEVLSSDMDILMNDIIEGKSGGTTILCKGSPGLGKTLTAEVYSEVVGKPLYRVHSGQLGTSPSSVETNLKAVLDRSSRWGAVMLIDEADVYIRKRDNDISHNAVVASFLRTLEYFDGLLFMTTNRSDDVDDAIMSRCIAMISYETPSAADAKRIWRVISNQFEMNLREDVIGELVSHFTHASGRDIKELSKLTSKYCRRKGIPMDFEAFRKCAQFKGM